MKEKMPYSYHTFMYPFSYSGGNDIINDNNCNQWEEEPAPENGKVELGKAQEKDVLLYNEYQYFLPQARKIIFNSDDSESTVGRHYYLKEINPKKENLYSIKTINGTEEKIYSLIINGIRLSVYPKFEIGILVFEMEYYPVSEGDHFSDVLEINDYGRRLFPPCIDMKLNSILTADEISIHINNCLRCRVRFNKDQYKNEQEIELVKQIIGIPDETQINIKSVLDERMFVACLVRDDKIGKLRFLKKLDKAIKPDKQENAKRIYEFIFLDRFDNCSCQSRRMRSEALLTHIYDRWIDYGSFHAITEYSFVCATGEQDGIRESVINPFLTSYVDMAKLALIQRAALTKMENEIPEIPDEELSDKQLNDIRNKRKRYVQFQSKIFLPEVTFQQQGVELYQMLKDSLNINTMNSNLEEKLDNLHNIAELQYQVIDQQSDKRINDVLNFMTAASLALALISMSQDYFFGIYSFQDNGIDSWTGFRYGVCVWAISAGVMLTALCMSHLLSKTDSKEENSKKEKLKKKNSMKKPFYLLTVFVYAVLFVSIVIKLLLF